MDNYASAAWWLALWHRVSPCKGGGALLPLGRAKAQTPASQSGPWKGGCKNLEEIHLHRGEISKCCSMFVAALAAAGRLAFKCAVALHRSLASSVLNTCTPFHTQVQARYITMALAMRANVGAVRPSTVSRRSVRVFASASRPLWRPGEKAHGTIVLPNSGRQGRFCSVRRGSPLPGRLPSSCGGAACSARPALINGRRLDHIAQQPDGDRSHHRRCNPQTASKMGSPACSYRHSLRDTRSAIQHVWHGRIHYVPERPRS